MTHTGLDHFGAYPKAWALFDLVVEDRALLQKDTRHLTLDTKDFP